MLKRLALESLGLSLVVPLLALEPLNFLPESILPGAQLDVTRELFPLQLFLCKPFPRLGSFPVGRLLRPLTLCLLRRFLLCLPLCLSRRLRILMAAPEHGADDERQRGNDDLPHDSARKLQR